MSALLAARVLRVLAVLALAVGIGAASAPPAAAHATLVSSSPTQDQVLDALPDRVGFAFSEDMSEPAYVIVTAPDGTSVTSGDPVVEGSDVTQALAASEVQGTYTMAYRAVSADGHPITGQITFDVGRSAGPGATTSAAASPVTASATSRAASTAASPTVERSSMHWVRIGVPVVLFALAAALFLLSRRSPA